VRVADRVQSQSNLLQAVPVSYYTGQIRLPDAVLKSGNQLDSYVIRQGSVEFQELCDDWIDGRVRS
jgi:hypothetical protein